MAQPDIRDDGRQRSQWGAAYVLVLNVPWRGDGPETKLSFMGGILCPQGQLGESAGVS